MRVSKSVAVLAVAVAVVGLVAGGCKGAPSAPAKAPVVQESAERAFAKEFYRSYLLHQDLGKAWDMMDPRWKEQLYGRTYNPLTKQVGDWTKDTFVHSWTQMPDFKRSDMPADLKVQEHHAKQSMMYAYVLDSAEFDWGPYVIKVFKNEQGTLFVTDAHFHKPGEKLP